MRRDDDPNAQPKVGLTQGRNTRASDRREESFRDTPPITAADVLKSVCTMHERGGERAPHRVHAKAEAGAANAPARDRRGGNEWRVLLPGTHHDRELLAGVCAVALEPLRGQEPADSIRGGGHGSRGLPWYKIEKGMGGGGGGACVKSTLGAHVVSSLAGMRSPKTQHAPPISHMRLLSDRSRAPVRCK
jgi:hypothetical protein